jgi:hypothetical protein
MTLQRNEDYRVFIFRYDVGGKLPSNYLAEDAVHTANLMAHSALPFESHREDSARRGRDQYQQTNLAYVSPASADLTLPIAAAIACSA